MIVPTTSPLISVTIPVYNSEKYLEESVRSALEQPYQNIEIIAVDDCSSDRSWEILRKLQKCDFRVQIFRNHRNMGVIATRNETLRRANGDYIAFLDSDDISMPDRFLKQVAFLQKNPDIGIVGSNAIIIDSDGNPTGKMDYPEHTDEIKRKVLLFQPFRQSSLIIRKRCFDEMGYFDESNLIDDYAFYIRFASRWEVRNLQERLVKYRIHGDNLTIYKQKEILRQILKIKRTAVFQYKYRISAMAVLSYFLTWSMIYAPPRLTIWLSNHLRKMV